MELLKNDTDAEGDPLTATVVTTTTNGVLTFNPDGSFTYVHDGRRQQQIHLLIR